MFQAQALCLVFNCFFLGCKLIQRFFCFLLAALNILICSALSVLVGAHRYYTHRAFKATLPLRILILFWFTVASQVSSLQADLVVCKFFDSEPILISFHSVRLFQIFYLNRNEFDLMKHAQFPFELKSAKADSHITDSILANY